jgi:hypothetical protein
MLGHLFTKQPHVFSILWPSSIECLDGEDSGIAIEKSVECMVVVLWVVKDRYQVVEKQFCVDLKRQKARIYSPWKGVRGYSPVPPCYRYGRI